MTNDRSPRRAHLAWFVAIGCAAAAVHWLVVVALVEQVHWQPLVANVAGWGAAVSVSFTGHHRLTFAGHGEPWHAALPRFVLLSASGFALNEAAYWALLRWSVQRYDVALAVVLVGVAGLTYVLSRHWVFARRPR